MVAKPSLNKVLGSWRAKSGKARQARTVRRVLSMVCVGMMRAVIAPRVRRAAYCVLCTVLYAREMQWEDEARRMQID